MCAYIFSRTLVTSFFKNVDVFETFRIYLLPTTNSFMKQTSPREGHWRHQPHCQLASETGKSHCFLTSRVWQFHSQLWAVGWVLASLSGEGIYYGASVARRIYRRVRETGQPGSHDCQPQPEASVVKTLFHSCSGQVAIGRDTTGSTAMLQPATRGSQLVNTPFFKKLTWSLSTSLARSWVPQSSLYFTLLDGKPNSIWGMPLAKVRLRFCAWGAINSENAEDETWNKLAVMVVHCSIHPFSLFKDFIYLFIYLC